MGMADVYWRLSLSDAFETAEWNGKRIKVRVLSPMQTRRSNVGNLLADDGYIALQTRYVYDYGINDVVKFRNKCYVITDIKRDTYEALPQSAAIMGARLQDITLDLFEVNQKTRNLRVDTPVITVANGKVAITCGTLDAIIYYTTDGTIPNSLSPVYKGEFELGTADTILAIAVKEGYAASEVSKYAT